MSFTLELFESAISHVLAEVRRVLRVGGRLVLVAMAKADKTNAMIDLYGWLLPALATCRRLRTD